MDLMNPEKINEALVEVDLPSTVLDLENPTEGYVVNLFTRFLIKNKIDVGTIKRPTPEQLNSMFFVDDNIDIIAMINLSETMRAICSQIFFKDFVLTDLMSPPPKKTRKIAGVLSNFLLYGINKNGVIEERLEVIKYKCQEVENINAERNKFIEYKKETALKNCKMQELKKQYEAEIERMKMLKIQRKTKIAELEKTKKAVQEAKSEVAQHYGSLKTQALQVYQRNEELESKLVKSPDKHKARLNELLEQKKKQFEQREVMQEAVMCKKSAIERIQSHLSIVSNVHAKFPEITKAYQSLIESKKQLEEVKKKVNEMNNLIKSESEILSDENTHGSGSILQNVKNQCEQHLASIRNELTELLNQKKMLERKYAEDQNHQQEIYLKRDEIRVSIQKVENNCKQFVAEFQELYDKEINTERRLKDFLDKKFP